MLAPVEQAAHHQPNRRSCSCCRESCWPLRVLLAPVEPAGAGRSRRGVSSRGPGTACEERLAAGLPGCRAAGLASDAAEVAWDVVQPWAAQRRCCSVLQCCYSAAAGITCGVWPMRLRWQGTACSRLKQYIVMVKAECCAGGLGSGMAAAGELSRGGARLLHWQTAARCSNASAALGLNFWSGEESSCRMQRKGFIPMCWPCLHAPHRFSSRPLFRARWPLCRPGSTLTHTTRWLLPHPATCRLGCLPNRAGSREDIGR
jgi:hypothetical protein